MIYLNYGITCKKYNKMLPFIHDDRLSSLFANCFNHLKYQVQNKKEVVAYSYFYCEKNKLLLNLKIVSLFKKVIFTQNIFFY